MSKLIVEMKMPKNCPCELSPEVFDPSGNYGGHQPCFAWYGIPARSKEFDRCVVRSERPSWCPIVGVLPDEHGDLIDRNHLIERCQRQQKDDWNQKAAPHSWAYAYEQFEEDVFESTPVIAAERKDDGK